MADADIDVLVLGREANARYVSGANRLWLAGTRPFAPGCVVVRETGAVHLLSVTDDGVPPSIPADRLYPITWNPMNLIGAVAAATAGVPVRRVGVDGMSPLFAQLLRSAFPDAVFTDGEALLRMVRRVKTADDLAGIRAAVDVAEEAYDAVVEAATPGRTPVSLHGIFEERMAQLGVTTPAFQPLIERHGDDWSIRAGVIRDGWEASLARTWPGGDDGPESRSPPSRSTGSTSTGSGSATRSSAVTTPCDPTWSSSCSGSSTARCTATPSGSPRPARRC